VVLPRGTVNGVRLIYRTELSTACSCPHTVFEENIL